MRYEVTSFHSWDLTDPNIDVLEADSPEEASKAVVRPGWIRHSAEVKSVHQGSLMMLYSDEGWHYAFVTESDAPVDFEPETAEDWD